MKLRQTALAALIGGACALASEASAAYPIPPLAVAPTSPVVQDKTKDKTVEQRLEDIEKKIAEFGEILKGRRDSEGFPIESDPGLVAELKNLQNEVARLNTQIEAMKTTTAQRPATPGAGTAQPTMGTVLIINEYPVEITMMINNRTYRVAPRTELKVPVPVGEFTYQLLNSGTSLTPTRAVVTEKDVIKLRVK